MIGLIVLNTLREVVRDRLFVAATILFVVAMLVALAGAYVAVGDERRLIIDVGLAAMVLIGLPVSALCGDRARNHRPASFAPGDPRTDRDRQVPWAVTGAVVAGGGNAWAADADSGSRLREFMAWPDRALGSRLADPSSIVDRCPAGTLLFKLFDEPAFGDDRDDDFSGWPVECGVAPVRRVVSAGHEVAVSCIDGADPRSCQTQSACRSRARQADHF
jgi:hypothetical protein